MADRRCILTIRRWVRSSGGRRTCAISYRKVLSSRIVNELTMGYGRFGFLFTQGEANPLWPDVPPVRL